MKERRSRCKWSRWTLVFVLTQILTTHLHALQIAPMAIGRIDIKYRRVDCTPPLPVSISIDNNVGVGGWLRLVVEVGHLTSADLIC